MENKVRNDRRKKQTDEKALNLEYSFNYGVDLENRIIRLTEDIQEFHFDMFDSALTALENESRKTVTLRLSSYGGDMYAALAIIGRMRNSKVAGFITEGYGKIMSGATAILAAGDKRSISSLTHVMHHEPSYEIGYDKHSNIQQEVKESETLSQMWASLFSELTGLPKQFWYEKGKTHDFYMSPDQCLRYNIVDEVF